MKHTLTLETEKHILAFRNEPKIKPSGQWSYLSTTTFLDIKIEALMKVKSLSFQPHQSLAILRLRVT